MTNIPKYKRYADIKRLDFIIEAINGQGDLSKIKVLDVGCGNGIISLNLGALGFQVVGLDVSSKAIDVANQQNTLSNVKFQVLPAEGLDALDQKFDVIICSEVLEHLDSPGDLLSQLHQILAIDGILIVTVPNGRGPRELLVTRPMIFIQRNLKFILVLVLWLKKLLGYQGTTIQSAADNLDHIQFFTRRGLTKMARQGEFDIVIFRHSNFLDDVFPFSLLARNSLTIQKADSRFADILPSFLVGGFFSVWKLS